MVLTCEAAKELEQTTRNQSDSDQWRSERRKRITASNIGVIAKMRSTTKMSKKVLELLYTGFKGNKATTYGSEKEGIARQEYITYPPQNNHPDLVVHDCGLFVSKDSNWLAATPDGLVDDPSDSIHPTGLLEIKNPYTAKDKDLTEACMTSSFYQEQCKLYCVDQHWCDFVVRTNKDIYVEIIYRDRKWWDVQLEKLKKFYFGALLPELARPRYRCGGIREPS